jgi:hypothetical protein
MTKEEGVVVAMSENSHDCVLVRFGAAFDYLVKKASLERVAVRESNHRTHYKKSGLFSYWGPPGPSPSGRRRSRICSTLAIGGLATQIRGPIALGIEVANCRIVGPDLAIGVPNCGQL